MAADNKTGYDRTKLVDTIRRSLGGSMVDIELEAEDYELAIDKALDQYRQQSENSTEESFMFLDLAEDVSEFFLPNEVVEVRQVFRRSIGTPGAGGSDIDPFELAFTNAYLLYPAASGGMATYYFYTIYQEELGKLFGFYLNFVWNTNTKKLWIQRAVRGPESVLLWVYNEKPDLILFSDRYSSPWIRDWAIAECKEILGNAYRKFQNIPGPSGGTSLPGNELVNEAKEMKEELRTRLRNYESGETPPWFVIG